MQTAICSLTRCAYRTSTPRFAKRCSTRSDSDETGWRVGAISHWLWAFVTPETTVYAICPSVLPLKFDAEFIAVQECGDAIAKTRTRAVERDLARVGKTIERLLTAYQEDLVSLDQLRERMPLLRQREQTLRHELNALVEQTRDRAAHLRLAETLSAFLTRLRASAGDARHPGAATDRAAPRQRGARQRRHDRDPPLHSRSRGTANALWTER